MNFEIIDNIFQVIVFSLIVVADIVCWFLHKNRLYIILALAHSCFMMGTLYFVLYLVIRGKVPQFFYVSEISWIASYLFLHSYQIVGYKGQRMKISVIPLELVWRLFQSGVGFLVRRFFQREYLH